MRPSAHFITVGSLALCQRCPRLLAFQRHRGARNAWRVGIKGNGGSYGSLFHKRVARPFFEAASEAGPLRAELAAALRWGVEEDLEWFVRENFFNPLLEELAPRHGGRDKILSMAAGTALWVRMMACFLAGIPSLQDMPEGEMARVFIRPEQRLFAIYSASDGGLKGPPCGALNVTGCYDALLFNPDRGEATLFEFKGYRRSDLAVPLSQSLIYAWLLWRTTGVIPSVQVFYLEEENGLDSFSRGDVQKMMAGLPRLFETALDVLSLRRPLPAASDEELCSVCPFQGDCATFELIE